MPNLYGDINNMLYGGNAPSNLQTPTSQTGGLLGLSAQGVSPSQEQIAARDANPLYQSAINRDRSLDYATTGTYNQTPTNPVPFTQNMQSLGLLGGGFGVGSPIAQPQYQQPIQQAAQQQSNRWGGMSPGMMGGQPHQQMTPHQGIQNNPGMFGRMANTQYANAHPWLQNFYNSRMR